MTSDEKNDFSLFWAEDTDKDSDKEIEMDKGYAKNRKLLTDFLDPKSEDTMSDQKGLSNELTGPIKSAVEQDELVLQQTTENPSGKSSKRTRATIDSKDGQTSPKVKKNILSSSEKPKVQKKRKKKLSAKARKARAKNILEFHEKNPGGGHITHGAGSKTIRKRYSDLRTAEGRSLKTIMDSLIDQLGGPETLSAAQQLHLMLLRPDLIVILQISKYVDEQKTIIKADGELMPVLKSYTVHKASIARSLEALFKSAGKKGKVPTIEDLMGAE